MKDQGGWARLGWQGISLDVPEDWCPGSLEGDFANGYLRVEDETSVRIELRWETGGRKPAPASQLVDAYLRQTRRKLRRGLPEPSVDRGRSVRELGGIDHEAFTWRSGPGGAHSLILVAPPSQRVVHVRVFFGAAGDDKALARRIFASARAAPQAVADEWAVFGFRFELPQEWRLEQSSLRTGSLQFVFKAGGDELEVVRQSLAEVTLRGPALRSAERSPLEQWLAGVFAKAAKGFRCTTRADRCREHAAARCAGVLSLRARPLAILRARRHLTALAWHCAEADKLFAIRCESNRPDDPRVARCADSIACH